MLKTKKLNLVVAISTALLLNSCNGQEIKKNENGLQYIFHKDVEGKLAALGDFIEVNMVIKTAKDSVLQNSYGSKPYNFPLQKGAFKGSLEEGLLLMSVGDSATFFVNADSLFNPKFGMSRPPFIAEKSLLHFTVKMEKIKSREQVENEMRESAEKRKSSDDQLIVEYMKTNNLTGIKTPTGLYYVKQLPGKGALAKAGDTVAVHYTGKLLNGTVFDSSRERGQPIEFPLGSGFVIPGWDQGIAMMAAGEKGLLLIPSHLAYGERDMGTIPANSVLTFDVELVKIKGDKTKAPAPKASVPAQKSTPKKAVK